MVSLTYRELKHHVVGGVSCVSIKQMRRGRLTDATLNNFPSVSFVPFNSDKKNSELWLKLNTEKLQSWEMEQQWHLRQVTVGDRKEKAQHLIDQSTMDKYGERLCLFTLLQNSNKTIQSWDSYLTLPSLHLEKWTSNASCGRWLTWIERKRLNILLINRRWTNMSSEYVSSLLLIIPIKQFRGKSQT